MPDARQRELVDAYLDGSLDNAGLAELDAAVRADALFRAWFARQCRREVALSAVLRRESEAEHNPTTTRLRRPSRRLRSLRRRPAALWPLAAAALLVLGLLGAWLHQRQDARPHDTAVAEVLAAQGGKAGDRPLAAGLRLDAGEQLRCIGPALLRCLASGATVELRPTTLVELRPDGLRLASGELHSTVPAQTPGRNFVISTPQVEVRVIGTRFTVSHADGISSVAVEEGLVEVRAGVALHRLGAGESGRWPASRPAAPTGAPPAAPMEPIPLPALGVLEAELMDALADRPIPEWSPLRPDAVVILARLPGRQLGLRFRVSPQVMAVRTQLIGPEVVPTSAVFEVIPPYTYPGDTDGDLKESWSPLPGRYRLVVQGYRDEQGLQPLGPPLQLDFSVLER